MEDHSTNVSLTNHCPSEIPVLVTSNAQIHVQGFRYPLLSSRMAAWVGPYPSAAHRQNHTHAYEPRPVPWSVPLKIRLTLLLLPHTCRHLGMGTPVSGWKSRP